MGAILDDPQERTPPFFRRNYAEPATNKLSKAMSVNEIDTADSRRTSSATGRGDKPLAMEAKRKKVILLRTS